MKGLDVHTSIRAISWDAGGAARRRAAKANGMDCIGIALPDPASTDAALGRRPLDAAGLPSVCSLGLQDAVWASRNRKGVVKSLTLAIRRAAGLETEAFMGRGFPFFKGKATQHEPI